MAHHYGLNYWVWKYDILLTIYYYTYNYCYNLFRRSLNSMSCDTWDEQSEMKCTSDDEFKKKKRLNKIIEKCCWRNGGDEWICGGKK